MLKVFTQFGAITITVITKNKNVISFNNNFTICLTFYLMNSLFNLDQNFSLSVQVTSTKLGSEKNILFTS